ncbi:hypothetical protein LINPERPRIM_LOCUS19575 [Linum perenne]
MQTRLENYYLSYLPRS